MATVSQRFVEVDGVTVRRSVAAALVIGIVVVSLGSGLAGAQSGETCLDIATSNGDSENWPTHVFVEGQNGDFFQHSMTTEASSPSACELEEDLDHVIYMAAPAGEYTITVRNEESAVHERWGAYDATVEDVEEESFWLIRKAPYHTEVSFDSPRDSDRFEPGETADFEARVYNTERSDTRDVTTEVYVYPEGSDERPDEPTKTLSTVSISPGRHATVDGSVTMPDAEGDYVVDVEFVTSYYGDPDFEDTSDYVDLGTVTVDAFEPPSIDDSTPSDGAVNVGPDERRTFSVSVSDPDSTPTVQWYVDGSRTTSGSSYAFDAERFGAGEHTVRAVASDGADVTADAEIQWTVDVANAPEITGVSPDGTVVLGTPVTFDVDTASAGHQYRWTVGSRTFSGNGVEKTFSSPGDRAAEVAVTNDRGVTATRSFVLSVERAPPSVTDLSVSPSSVTVGESVDFVASAADPTERSTSLDYEWTVDGRTFAGSSVETTFSQAGTYDVALTVTNDYGSTTTRTRTVTVEAAPPEITDLSVSPSSVTAGERISLSAAATDPAGRGTGFTYRWTVGDESFSGATAETRLSAVGTREVTLTVENEYGTTTTRSQSVTVSNDDPTLERRSPESRPTPRAGTEQRFLVRVADADAEPATVTWSVDGQRASSRSVSADERRVAFTHHFTDPGTHTVEVTVEDGHGARTSLDWTVAVENRPPRIQTAGPASATFSRMSGTTETFNVTGTDPDGGPVSYRWLVDGSQQSTGPRYTHAFDATGTRNVTVVATDSDGGVATRSWSAAVRNFRRAPEIDSSATITTLEPGDETRFIGLSFRNPSVNNRTANVELALSLPSGVTVSATRNIRDGTQPEYVGEATVTPGQQTSISLAITAQEGLAGQQIDVPYQVIYYPAGQRDSYRVVENATTTIRIVGDETATGGSANDSSGTADGGDSGQQSTDDSDSGSGDDPELTTGSGPGFTAGTLLLVLPLWLLARRW